MVKFIVKIYDVDGKSQRTYKNAKGAIKRFEEMTGLTVAAAISEQYYYLAEAGKPLPTFDQVKCLVGVGTFGNRVYIEKEQA